MKKSLEKLVNAKKGLFNIFISTTQAIFTTVKYRVLTVEKDTYDDYVAVIQVINKQKTFKMKPEEILADDLLTDAFSPRDIRSLTYLGYLGVNSPKYKVMAQRLSEQDDKIFFAIQEKGKKKAIIKSADEISADAEFLKSLDQKDAHMVGFVTATEQAALEKKLKQKLITATTKKD